MPATHVFYSSRGRGTNDGGALLTTPMQRAVRFLRVALPIVFVAFLVLIGLTYSGNVADRRPVEPPVTATSPVQEDRIESLGYLFEDTQTVAGKVLSKIRARRTTGFQSGWYTLEDVELTIFRDKGVTYQLIAPSAQFHAETKAAEVRKGVLIKSSTGITVKTEEIKFDGNRLVNNIPLTFTAQNWNGRAGGIEMNLQNETMHLIGGVTATSIPPPAEPPVNITSKSAEFLQQQGEATFRDDVVITRAGDSLKTEAVTARLDQAHKVLVALDGCCKVDMQLRAGSSLVPAQLSSGGSRIEAKSFTSDIGPAGEIRGIRALGAPARAAFTGPPPRTMRANEIAIAFQGERITAIRSEGKVNLLEEAAGTKREIDAGVVTLYMDPQSHKLSSAVAEHEVRLRDPRTTATAMRANYDMVNGVLLLSTDPKGALPTVVSEGHQVRAEQIELTQRSRVVQARGSVLARMAPQPKGVSASQTALFPSGDGPVFVNSESLLLRQDDKVAVFNGKVRAWQGNNVLFAETLQLESAGESLNARGDVRGMFYNVKGEKRTAPIGTHSDALIAKKAERTVNLEGHVKIEDEARTMNADRATIYLDAANRVDRVEANGNLVVTERNTGRRATGSHALYKLAEKTLQLDGAPAEVSEPRGVVRGKQILFDIARNKVNVVNEGESTEATYHPE